MAATPTTPGCRRCRTRSLRSLGTTTSMSVSPGCWPEADIKERRRRRSQATATSTVELPVHVQPGMHPTAVSVAVGYGRRAAGKVGNGAGVDVFPFAQVGAAAVLLRVSQSSSARRAGSIAWRRPSGTRLTENRPIINDITLDRVPEESRRPPIRRIPHLRMEKVPIIWPARVQGPSLGNGDRPQRPASVAAPA